MTSPRMTVGVASNERRMFEITIPSIGKIVCETSTKLDGPTSGREDERKALAALAGQFPEANVATALKKTSALINPTKPV